MEKQSTSHYIKTRFTELFPTRKSIAEARKITPINPFPALSHMDWTATKYFLIGFAAWTWDAFDFFSVSLNATNIAKSLNVTVKDITWGITLVLMLRSVGAVIFGYIGDRYGRKIPYVVNIGLLVVFEIATSFVKTYKQFLGVRALFGIAMGAVFGIASATALENAPKECRSILSGIFQEGYALGYLLVVIFQRAITDNSSHGWRALFWFAPALPTIFIICRILMPESPAYLVQKENMKMEAARGNDVSFATNAKKALKLYWLQLLYMVLLMIMFNFMSHGSQDLFPTLLTKEYNFNDNQSTVTNAVANLGAIVGGIVVSHASAFFGRRFMILICAIGGGAMIYPWAFISGPGINAAVFFLQFFVQGAWGVIPIHLTELSPVEFKAFVTGVSYQLGNLASSASSTIEATIGERFPLKDSHGNIRPGVFNYGKVVAIFMGCVFAGVFIVTLIGPENRNGEIRLTAAHLDVDESMYADADMEGNGNMDMEKQYVELKDNKDDKEEV